jgi:hypothetical protein
MCRSYIKVRGKRKFRIVTGHEDSGGGGGAEGYSCTVPLNLGASWRVGVERHASAAVPPGKETRYPLYWRLWAPGPV